MGTNISKVLLDMYVSAFVTNKNHFKKENYPVETVTWFNSIKFCNHLSKLQKLTPAYVISNQYGTNVTWNKKANGYRLPTEAEWEYAAKSGTEFIYAGSNDVNEVAWYSMNADAKTHLVGQKKPNSWGLYDCSGNIYEWCSDKWDLEAYANRKDLVVDPHVYSNDFEPRSIRGGSWHHGAGRCRVHYREYCYPDDSSPDIGLRIVRFAE